MEIIKFGVIGLLIMIPFFFVGSVNSSQVYMEHRMETYLKQEVEEAVYDSAFAMKAYHEWYFDSENAYHIRVPRQQVVDVFFDSLDFRDFSYSKVDFPILMFVEYDGVVIYNPSKDYYFPKMYYVTDESDEIFRYTLGDKVDVYQVSGGWLRQEAVDQDKRDRIILATVQAALNHGAHGIGLGDDYYFDLPISDDGFYDRPINDLSFSAVYIGKAYYGLGFSQLVELKPSGIMKRKKIITY